MSGNFLVIRDYQEIKKKCAKSRTFAQLFLSRLRSVQTIWQLKEIAEESFEF